MTDRRVQIDGRVGADERVIRDDDSGVQNRAWLDADTTRKNHRWMNRGHERHRLLIQTPCDLSLRSCVSDGDHAVQVRFP